MDDVATAKIENENLRKIRQRLLQWEGKSDSLAALNAEQEEYLEILTSACRDDCIEAANTKTDEDNVDAARLSQCGSSTMHEIKSRTSGLNSTNDFLLFYDRVHNEIEENKDATYQRYLEQLERHSSECRAMLAQINEAMQRLDTLSEEYQFVSQKASALNTASEKLIEEQEKLQELSNEIQRRLHYFSQVESLQQRLQSSTLSVASETFRECLNRIDESLEYLRANPKFKDSAAYVVKYKHCLSKAVNLIKSYVGKVLEQAAAATLHPKQSLIASSSSAPSANSSEAAFALYYGKYQTSAAKIKRISELVECRLEHSAEYEQLLSDMQQNYLSTRATIMSPAVDKAINELKNAHKGDHCSLTRSACAFLVHVCQDEHRLYFQFFGVNSAQLNAYLEGLCTILYDTLRPFIIHINHLETLAEICSILRIEMLKDHVQHNPEALEAFASTANQLLQDVQERLVFRAHLYLQSDILNYNPSAGDLAYPEKLEMMESIALSLQEPQQTLRRTDSRSSLVSSASSAVETESVDTAYRMRNMNSPADLHGMWYPTVRRTLVCLSRLYRCVDRPIFQGLSQEALKLCIQSVSSAAAKISAAKTRIDGELFEIKHLLILREQIAPFRVDFTIKETSLDFSKVKTAAFGLLQKRKQLFSMGSNNALLEFLLDGTPQIKEHLLDSRKEVDRQLKLVCEQFIKDAGQMLTGPLIAFLERAQNVLATNTSDQKSAEQTNNTPAKVNYNLRQSNWASPQQISSVIQETQRLIKSKLATLQRAMQLYLSNRDTEFIIFRPIRNNIIQNFVKLEQILTTNGYTSDDMIITGCPTAEQVSILLSSTSILAAEGIANFLAARKMSTTSIDGASVAVRKTSFDRKSISFDGSAAPPVMEHVAEVPESIESQRASPINDDINAPAMQAEEVGEPTTVTTTTDTSKTTNTTTTSPQSIITEN